MKRNIVCIALALVFIVAAIAPVTALASSTGDYYFYFEFEDLENYRLADHTKGDTDQYWVLTLYNDGTNNLSSSNIFGAKMNSTDGRTVDRYHTFSNYVSHYAVNYEATVYSNDTMYLGIKKDDKSKSSENLIISGAYNP